MTYTVITHATVLSVDDTVGDLPSGDILLRDDTIVAVGSDLVATHPDARDPRTTVLDATGMIAVPGFVDSHVHAWEGQLRGLAPVVDFGGYLGLTAFGYGPHYRPQDNYAGTLATALVALDAGVTTLVDNGHNALSPEHVEASVEALVDVGIRAVHAVGSPFGSDLPHVPATAVALRDRYAGTMIDIRLFEVNPSHELWSFAAATGLWVSTELGPHTPGIDTLMADLAAAGLLTPQHAFNHAYDLAPETWRLIGGSGAAINLAARSDAMFGLGSAVSPVDHAVAHGVPIGLSNDNEISYGLSMFAEMQALQLRHRGEAFRRRAAGEEVESDHLDPATLLRYATLGGAANAGLDHRIGSLTPGKQADLVLINNDRVVTDPYAAVTAFAGVGDVDTVIVAGKLVKRGGRFVSVDLDGARQVVTGSRTYLNEVVGTERVLTPA